MVKQWFKDQFGQLHPLLQTLHLEGGQLVGDVEIHYGKGLAGLLGRRMAKKMNLPCAGVHSLAVNIFHDEAGLHWHRCFNGEAWVKSLFVPVGNISQGHWLEHTGLLSMKLTVDIHQGGWYWRCLGLSVCSIPIPRCLVPRTQAYKLVEQGQYRFYVGLSLPLLGTLVAYRGLLQSHGASADVQS